MILGRCKIQIVSMSSICAIESKKNSYEAICYGQVDLVGLGAESHLLCVSNIWGGF